MGTNTPRRSRTKLIVGGLTVAFLAATGISAAWAVTGGEDVQDGQFGFAVLLDAPEIPNADGTTRASACSAALVAPQWVATAGHCFRDVQGERVSGPPQSRITATAGRATIDGPGGETRVVVDVRQSPTTDFALARLDSPIENVEPIKLNTQAPVVGDIVRIAGWGSSTAEADLSQRPDRLQTGEFTVQSVTEDNVFITSADPAKQTSACPFDSGAPYFIESLEGTASLVATEITGPACPHTGAETTARVDTMLEWIGEQDPSLLP